MQAHHHFCCSVLLTFTAALLGLSPGLAQGQTCSNGEWLPGDALVGVNGTVYCSTAWDPDGAGPVPELLVVGGEFSLAGDLIVRNIATYNPTSRTWSDLGGGTNGVVRALAVMPDRSLAVGGSFTEAGTTPASRIALWKNQQWESLGSGVSSRVTALCVGSDGQLYAGGGFMTAGGVAASRVARWNGASWNPMGAGFNAEVLAVAALHNGSIVAGGTFSSTAGQSTRGVAVWNGSTWQELGGGVSGFVKTLHVAASGELIAGGAFTSAGTQSVNKIAAWDGTSWRSLGSGLNDPNADVSCVTSKPDGHIIACGSFDFGASRSVAGWNGAEWYGLNTGLKGRLFRNALTVCTLTSGDVFVGGTFESAGSASAASIAGWQSGSWFTLSPGNGGYGFPAARSITQLPNGLIAVFGLPQLQGVEVNGQGVLAYAGSSAPFAPGATVDGVYVESSGTLLATGSLASDGFNVVNRILRWNGVDWHALGTPIDGHVYDFATLADGTLLAAGVFGGTFEPEYSIAAWNGTDWVPFEYQVTGTILEFERLANGTLIAAASVSNPSALPSVIQLSDLGWTPLGTHLRAAAVRGIEVLSSGDVITSGRFVSDQNEEFNGLARWNGVEWDHDWAITDTSSLGAMLALPNGGLVVGGLFNHVNGVSVSNIALFDGNKWSSMNGGTNNLVLDVERLPSGDVLVGGYFQLAGGRPSPYIATWRPSCPAECDSIDFNNDTSFFDPQDIEAFLSVYSEGPCIPATATCNDIDYNNDGSIFDPCDINSFLLVFSEGPCTLCGL